MGLVLMLARVKHQKGDKAEIEEHVFAYHRFHRMLLVPERIADELLGYRVSDDPT